MKYNSRKKTNRRVLTFLIVGTVNTLLDFAFYTLLASVLLPNSSMLQIGIISGTFALVCAFLTHSGVTWRGHKVHKGTILRFFAFTGFGMWILRPLLLSLFIKLTPLYAFATILLNKIGIPFNQGFVTNTGAFGFMVVILLIYNYLTYDRFVFKKTT